MRVTVRKGRVGKSFHHSVVLTPFCGSLTLRPSAYSPHEQTSTDARAPGIEIIRKLFKRKCRAVLGINDALVRA